MLFPSPIRFIQIILRTYVQQYLEVLYFEVLYFEYGQNRYLSILCFFASLCFFFTTYKLVICFQSGRPQPPPTYRTPTVLFLSSSLNIARIQRHAEGRVASSRGWIPDRPIAAVVLTGLRLSTLDEQCSGWVHRSFAVYMLHIV